MEKQVIANKQKQTVKDLNDLKKLITDLNTNLLALKQDREEYHTQLNECKGLCHKIRELMDATTARIIEPRSQ